MYKVFSKGKIHYIEENQWDSYCKDFQLVYAAGGLVANVEGELLLIFRRGFWDLPKGKQEIQESLEQTAIREVQEECGVRNLTISGELLITHYTYQLFGYPILKTTKWYKMSCSDAAPLVPQSEEGIEKAVWVKPCDMPKFMNKSYVSVHDVIEEYFKTITL